MESLVKALLLDRDNCASISFGEECRLCVLNHPDQLREERVGYYIVLEEARGPVLKDVVEGYETLMVYLRHAGVSVEEGWLPASEHLAQRVKLPIFSLCTF
jgi:hypothetical protein